MTDMGYMGEMNKNKPLKQYAYDFIKKKILNCEYAPGLHLNEQQLCEAMDGISRTPVRDALSRLEQEGLLNILPKKGIIVSELRISDINRIFEVRMLLEPYALQRYGNRLAPDQLAYFSQVMSDYTKVPYDSFYDLDDQFHGFIMSSMQNQYLLDTYQNINNMNQRLRTMSGNLVANRLSDTFTEHMAIINACRSQDWKGAAEAMTRHLEASRISTFQMIVENEGNF